MDGIRLQIGTQGGALPSACAGLRLRRTHDPDRHTETAFEAIASTLPVGSVLFEPEIDAKGERMIWLEPVWVDKLAAMRGPGVVWEEPDNGHSEGAARVG